MRLDHCHPIGSVPPFLQPTGPQLIFLGGSTLTVFVALTLPTPAPIRECLVGKHIPPLFLSNVEKDDLNPVQCLLRRARGPSRLPSPQLYEFAGGGGLSVRSVRAPRCEAPAPSVE